MFNREEISKLLKGDPISADLPFDNQDDESIRAFYEPIIQAADRCFDLRSQIEWNHYGCGYASFIDAWFYRADQGGRLTGLGERHIGIWILLSRTTRFFVMGQGEKSWSEKGGSGYLPSLDKVDEIDHWAIAALTVPLANKFTAAGLARLSRKDLEETLNSNCEVPTILSDPPYKLFDALFHWED